MEFAVFFSDLSKGLIYYFPFWVAPGIVIFPGALQRGALPLFFCHRQKNEGRCPCFFAIGKKTTLQGLCP